jgi:Transcriptional regulators
MGLQGFTEVAQSAGRKPKTKVISLSKVNISLGVQEILNVGSTDSMVMLERLRFLDEEPMVLEKIVMNENTLQVLNKMTLLNLYLLYLKNAVSSFRIRIRKLKQF